MTVPVPLRDEPGTRTRMAWGRTALVLLAVTALTYRGLLMGQARPWQLVLAALPALAFGVLAMGRARRIGPTESPGVSRGVILATTGLVGAVALLAITAMVP